MKKFLLAALRLGSIVVLSLSLFLVLYKFISPPHVPCMPVTTPTFWEYVLLFGLPIPSAALCHWFLYEKGSVRIYMLIIFIFLFFALMMSTLNTPRDRSVCGAAKASLGGARAQAELYYDTRGSYEGVCLEENKLGQSDLSAGIYSQVEYAARQAKQPFIEGVVDVNQSPFESAKDSHAKCNDSKNAYAAEVHLIYGLLYFCIDSSGRMQENPTPGLTATNDYSCEP